MNTGADKRLAGVAKVDQRTGRPPNLVDRLDQVSPVERESGVIRSALRRALDGASRTDRDGMPKFKGER